MFQKTAKNIISKIGTRSWNSSPNEFQAGSSPFASSMKREIICLEMEFRTSGCEIQRQQYSIIENLMKSTIFKCSKPVIFRYDIMMTSSFIQEYICCIEQTGIQCLLNSPESKSLFKSFNLKVASLSRIIWIESEFHFSA